MAVPYTFGSATTSIPLSQLDSNFATAITIGNTAVYLGNTTTSFGNVTLNNVTIASGNVTVTKITAPTHDAGSGNALTLQSNSTTAIYVDTSQNVGIGTSSFNYSSSGRGLVELNGSSNAMYGLKVNGVGKGYLYHDGTNLFLQNGASGVTVFYGSSSNESMRIDSSGYLLVGTTAAYSPLTVNGSNRFDTVTFGDITTASNNCGIYLRGTSATGISWAGGYLAFYGTGIGSGERMRIDTSGNLLVGLTSGGGSKLEVSASTEIARFWNTGGTGNIRFVNSGGSTIGYIQWSGSSTSYVTSSDYRLKENVTPMTTGLEKISALKPVNYDWINDKSQGEGFIAHELQTVIPAAVTGEKDAVDADGKPAYQGVDYSKIVVHLVAAIQELSAKVDAQAAEITALKAKVGA